MLWSSPTDRLSKLLKEANLGVLPPRVSLGPEMRQFLQKPPKCPGGLGSLPQGLGEQSSKHVPGPPRRSPEGWGGSPEAQADKQPEASGCGGSQRRTRAFLLPPWPCPLHLHLSPHFPPFFHKLVSEASALGPMQPAEAGLCPSREPQSRGQGAAKQAGCSVSAQRGAHGRPCL